MNTIFNYYAQDIEQLVVSLEQPKYRAQQLIQWLYKRGASSYDEMGNLPKKLRDALKESAPLIPPVIIGRQVSKDGTQKYLLELADGCEVETVAIPSHDHNAAGEPRRLTVCFSTQVGCPMGCSFCATGKQGFTRNLAPGEMVWQLLTCEREMGIRVSNAVGMGQGEPFLNFDNTLAALRFMNSPDGMGIGARHITISTCGISSGIHSFSHVEEQFTLAVSLHSAIQQVRDMLMPVSAGTPLNVLKDELSFYQQKTGRRITLEYLMIHDVTDTPESCDALIGFCKRLSVHINLLKINPVKDSPYQPSKPSSLDRFRSTLEDAGIETTIRISRGADIDSACGQLKNSR